MGIFAQHRRTLTAFAVGLIGILAIALAASAAGARKADRLTTLEGTIWVANRGAHTIRGFDAATGSVVRTVAMALRLSAGGSRVRTRQALRGRGVRHAARRSRSSIPKRASSRSGSSSHPARGHTTSTGVPAATSSPSGSTERTRSRWSIPTTDSLLGPWDTDPTKHDRARPRCRLLEGRQDPVRRERHDRRGRSHSSRGPAKCSGGWTCPERTSSPCPRTGRRPS